MWGLGSGFTPVSAQCHPRTPLRFLREKTQPSRYDAFILELPRPCSQGFAEKYRTVRGFRAWGFGVQGCRV